MKNPRYVELCEKVAHLDTSIAALEDDRAKAEREMEEIEAAHIKEDLIDPEDYAVSSKVCSSEDNPLVFCVYNEMGWPLVCVHCGVQVK